MARKTEEFVVRTREEADKIADNRGIPGYSESRVQSGPTEVLLTDGTMGWKVVKETYYG